MGVMVAESLSARLKRLRHERGLSQRELAAPGVSYAYISRIEAGTRRPSVKALRLLAANLGVSTEYLEVGRERTMTDDLLDRLSGSTGSGVTVTVARSDAPESVFLEWNFGTERRAVQGECLTVALREAVAFQVELERIRAERERLAALEQEHLAQANVEENAEANLELA